MKVALFGFNGESMCFVHVMLTALEMRGHPSMARYMEDGYRIIPF